MFHKVLWHDMQPVKPGTPGLNPFSLWLVHWVLLRVLHNTRDHRVYVPSEKSPQLLILFLKKIKILLNVLNNLDLIIGDRDDIINQVPYDWPGHITHRYA